MPRGSSLNLTKLTGSTPPMPPPPRASGKNLGSPLALSQQLGVQAHACVHNKHAVVHVPHLHGTQVPGVQGLQQFFHRLLRLRRQSMFAAEAVEGAMGTTHLGTPACSAAAAKKEQPHIGKGGYRRVTHGRGRVRRLQPAAAHRYAIHPPWRGLLGTSVQPAGSFQVHCS